MRSPAMGHRSHFVLRRLKPEKPGWPGSWPTPARRLFPRITTSGSSPDRRPPPWNLLADIPDLDLILTPVGGGGLVSGTALTVRGLSSPSRVIAAEPKGADDAYRSFRAGRIIPSVNPQTIADGLLTSLGDKTFAIIRDCVDDIVTVEEADIIRAMRLIWERMKIIVEPSAAVPLGALLSRSVDVQGKRVAIILSGGNVDLARLPFS